MNSIEFSHISVMLKEAVDGLNVREGGIYVDGTAGGGGHSYEIAKRLGGSGRLICIDQDPDAIEAASNRLAEFDNVTIVQANFSSIKAVLMNLGVFSADGILLDLGVSSHQLDAGERGFSYHFDAPLDMRMSRDGLSAYDVVNTFSAGELVRILSVYGEEKYAKNIVRSIMKAREEKPVETTFELAALVSESYPAKARRSGHPARKTFQAIRIAVNHELEVLEIGLESSFEVLNVGGRLSVITFHSLEDRITKRAMNNWCSGCTCPPDFPVCVCGNRPEAKLVNRKPILPSAEEIEANNRSRSAKLRVCEKIYSKYNDADITVK